MAIQILQISLIVARLKAQVPAFDMIEGAAGLETAMHGGARKLPACFVVAASEQSSVVTNMPGAVHQRVVDQFDVVYAVKNISNRGGATAFDDDLRLLRMAAMQALIGWEPEPSFGVCTHNNGALITLANGVIWWKDRFETEHYNTV